MCFLAAIKFLLRKACCLSVVMPRLTTTPKRLRSGARRRPLVPVGPSPASVKKLRVDMLRGYLASYQLPTTGTKQQLAERLTYHLRSIAAKKIQRSSGQQKNSRAGGKKTQKSTQPEAPPPREPTPHESSDSEEDTGSQESPSGEQGSPRSPPSGGRKSRSRRAKPYSRHRSRQRSHSTSSEEHSLSDSQSSASSEEHSTRARKRHASHSHAPPPKHRRYRRSRSTSSESPRRRRHHRATCHLPQHLRTHLLQAPHLHLIIDATVAVVNTAATQQMSHL